MRRKEIPKPDGGVRKLGITTVKDRIVQQAIAQQLIPLYEPKFRKGAMATGQEEVRRMPSSRFGDMRMKGMNGQYSSI